MQAYIVALDAATGEEMWKYPTDDTDSTSATGIIYSSAGLAIDKEGNLYAGLSKPDASSRSGETVNIASLGVLVVPLLGMCIVCVCHSHLTPMFVFSL
jgi:outer membrane protein assembly factor BamB